MQPLLTKKKNYPTIGQCIYCLKDQATLLIENDKLTEEHIIARALNGEHIFKGAACKKCSDHINKTFEQPTLKTTLLTPKMVLEFKRRKRNKEPLRPYPIAVNQPANVEKVYNVIMEPKEFPPLFALPHFIEPGFLTEFKDFDGFSQVRIQFIQLKPMNEWALRHSIENVGHNTPIVFVEFALSVAKTAYSYAIAELGMNAFEGSQIRDLILGERHDISNFVGAPLLKRSNLTRRYLHNLHIRKEGDYCTVLVHLFAPYGASPYQVVLGKYL